MVIHEAVREEDQDVASARNTSRAARVLYLVLQHALSREESRCSPDIGRSHAGWTPVADTEVRRVATHTHCENRRRQRKQKDGRKRAMVALAAVGAVLVYVEQVISVLDGTVNLIRNLTG